MNEFGTVNASRTVTVHGIFNSSTDKVDLEKATVTVVPVVPVDGNIVHVRVNVGSKANLPSATKFTFKVEGGEDEVGSAIFRNLYTQYGAAEVADRTWYDVYKAEGEKEFTIATDADFYGFSVAAQNATFDGETIYLVADIEANKGTATRTAWVPGEGGTSHSWTPIGPQNSSLTNPDTAKQAFRGTFDGQGHTISGIYLKDTYNEAGLFSWVIDCKIKNFELTNSYFTSNSIVIGSIVGNGDGELSRIKCSDSVYINVENTATTMMGGIIARVQDYTNSDANNDTKCTITECWFDGVIKCKVTNKKNLYFGAVGGYFVHGTVTIENSLYTGESNLQAAAALYAGGFSTDNNTAGSSITVKNCLSAGTIQATKGTGDFYVGSVGGRIGTDAQKTKGTFENVYATTECSENAIGLANGTVNGQISSISENTILDMEGYRKTSLDFDTYWSVRTGEVPALKYFYGEGLDISNENRKLTKDTSWYDEDKDNFTISTAEAFLGFASLVNEGKTFEGKEVKLGKNINLNRGWTAGEDEPENVWTPIGSNKKPTSGKDGSFFEGVFDGNGNTISGIYVKDDTSYSSGLFGYVSDSTIGNFQLVNSYFSFTGTAMGSIVGYGDGTLRNIYTDAMIHSTGSQVGGFFGRVQDKNANGAADSNEATLLEITNCWFDGTIEIEKQTDSEAKNNRVWTGGLVGYVQYGTVNIDNCLWTGMIKATYTGKQVTTANLCIGGLVGSDGAGVKVAISNTISAGDLDLEVPADTLNYVGSAVGYLAKTLVYGKNVFVRSDYSGYAQYSVGEPAVSGATTEGIASKNKLVTYEAAGWLKTTDLNTSIWAERAGKVPGLAQFVEAGFGH